MIRAFIITLLIMLAPLAQAQPHRPDLTPDQAENLRNRGLNPDRHWDNRYPRWCRSYDRRDYWRERRACGEDRRCLHDVRRKAERCGLR